MWRMGFGRLVSSPARMADRRRGMDAAMGMTTTIARPTTITRPTSTITVDAPERWVVDISGIAERVPDLAATRRLAVACSRTPESIRAYLAGRRVPPADTLARMAEAVGLTPLDCFRLVD